MNTFYILDTIALAYLIFKITEQPTLWGKLLSSLDRQENWDMISLNNIPKITTARKWQSLDLNPHGLASETSIFDYVLILKKYLSSKLFQVSEES